MSFKSPVKIFLCFLLFISVTVVLSAQQGRGKGRVHGKVMDEEGNPLKGVKIVATSYEYQTTFDSKSDKRGNWAIGGLGTGYFRFAATLEGYEMAFHDMQVSQFSRQNKPIEFVLKKIPENVPLDSQPDVKNKEILGIFHEGTRLLQERKYEEAIAKFEEFLVEKPEFIQTYINIGNAYREMENYEKALESYNIILEKVKEEKGSFEGDENAARALASIGETYIRQGELEKGGEFLRQSVDLLPKDEAIAFNVAEILFKQREIDQAIEYYIKAININPKWPPPHKQLGYAYINKGEYKLAIEAFQKYIEAAPDAPDVAVIQNLIPQLQDLIQD